MNKQEFIEKVNAKLTKASHAEIERGINAFIETVKEAVAAGESVQFVGFGTFEARERAAREARNPQTGETLKIAAKKVPVFKAGKGFKDAVNK